MNSIADNVANKTSQSIENNESKQEIVIGSDEAGKGEWLGPMTIAAVALTKVQSIHLRRQGVMDSKELRTDRIVELATAIRHSCASQHVVMITPQRFNQFLTEIRNEGKSLNDMLAWGHATAINKVYGDIMRTGVHHKIKIIIDEFDRIKTEKRLQRVINLGELVLEQRPKAEEEIPVAAAGILARATREDWIDKESKRLNKDLRKISPAEVMTMREAMLIAKASFLERQRR